MAASIRPVGLKGYLEALDRQVEAASRHLSPPEAQPVEPPPPPPPPAPPAPPR